MNNQYVYYSDSVGAPSDKITIIQEEIYFKMQKVDEAVNDGNYRYAHYYYKKMDEYGNSEYIYIGTKNA